MRSVIPESGWNRERDIRLDPKSAAPVTTPKRFPPLLTMTEFARRVLFRKEMTTQRVRKMRGTTVLHRRERLGDAQRNQARAGMRKELGESAIRDKDIDCGAAQAFRLRTAVRSIAIN